MMTLKPCWLMSPLSISQMLPLQEGLFDVIIFDEASQVRVEDAVPSIFRANKLIVVGDKEQMPPTNFFIGTNSDDDGVDDEEELSPSILDLASQVFPTQMLEWHYRSRSESLIAFSNRAFYGGRLIAVPNPHVITEDGAITYTHVLNAFFKNRSGNEVEAIAVITALCELLKSNPNRSFGIIAMGQPQVEALDAALEAACSKDAIFRELIEKARNYVDKGSDAGFFVKNLENVQGDERDVILLSSGYGASGPDKKVYLNFGPLSKSGGSRRLNVAITRAKSQMHVFSSFDPSTIPSDEEAFGRNPDSAIFGRFLRYAKALQSKNLESAVAVLNSFPVSGHITGRKSSRFSKIVKMKLQELGYEVSEEIGSSGFYIDLGVHHPKVPGSFVLGIECDGHIWHSHPYARDRDKIREKLLTDRGWQIERICSLDWSRDWKKEVAKIDSLLKKKIGYLNAVG